MSYSVRLYVMLIVEATLLCGWHVFLHYAKCQSCVWLTTHQPWYSM